MIDLRPDAALHGRVVVLLQLIDVVVDRRRHPVVVVVSTRRRRRDACNVHVLDVVVEYVLSIDRVVALRTPMTSCTTHSGGRIKAKFHYAS